MGRARQNPQQDGLGETVMGSKEEQDSKEEQCSKEKQRECLKNEIKYDFGNVFYTYVAHHKTADRLEYTAHWVSLFQIALIALTSTGILVNLSIRYSCIAILMCALTSLTSVLSLFLKLYVMEFKPHDEAIKHRNAADDLWKIRKEYISLLTDFNSLEINEIQQKRGRFSEKVAGYYSQPTCARAPTVNF